MKVSQENVRKVFDDILECRMTREAADRWALELLPLNEIDSLIFDPVTDSEVIWDSIVYLYGIGLEESPGRYLLTDDDIRETMSTILTRGKPPTAA